MKPYISMDGRNIGPDYAPYIIAELSANHNGDINRAFQIMEEAKKSGADAIKLQTYTADTLTMDCKLPHFEATGPWQGQYLHDLYKTAYMPWDFHAELSHLGVGSAIRSHSWQQYARNMEWPRRQHHHLGHPQRLRRGPKLSVRARPKKRLRARRSSQRHLR